MKKTDFGMASRPTVPDKQPKVAVGRKVKNGQAEVRPRRVLGDIGNVAISVAGNAKPQIGNAKPQIGNAKPQIGRLNTRRSGAQLSSNAQAAVVKRDNSKKALAKVTGKGSGADANKEDVKSKKISVIAISPDEEQSYKSREGSSKERGRTLTGILTARSKATCGPAKRPKEVILDIDAPDVNNELAVVEYIEDIYSFYKLTENDECVRDYMGSQIGITSKMRETLVDWLIGVHVAFNLSPESLYLTINIVDRFLSVKPVSRRELQLIGISSMLIACKYEELWAPMVVDFITISDNAYVREQILLMEKAILEKLEWYITVPTPYVFLVRYVKASVPADKKMENMAFFYAELGLVNYSTAVRYCPSMLAASSIYAARCALKRIPHWTETLKHHTGFNKDQLMDCAKLLANLHLGLAGSKLKAVSRKYTSPEKSTVALLAPAKCLLQAP